MFPDGEEQDTALLMYYLLSRTDVLVSGLVVIGYITLVVTVALLFDPPCTEHLTSLRLALSVAGIQLISALFDLFYRSCHCKPRGKNATVSSDSRKKTAADSSDSQEFRKNEVFRLFGCYVLTTLTLFLVRQEKPEDIDASLAVSWISAVFNVTALLFVYITDKTNPYMVCIQFLQAGMLAGSFTISVYGFLNWNKCQTSSGWRPPAVYGQRLFFLLCAVLCS
eukprot:g67191.t1